MSIHPTQERTTGTAALAGVVAACLLFICLAYAVRLPILIALVLAIFGGGTVLAAVVTRRSSATQTERPPVVESAAEQVAVQLRALPVTGVRLPSALADYTFTFSAQVLWAPAPHRPAGTGDVAVHEIIRRASKITEQQHPSRVSVIAPGLATALATLQPDQGGRVQVKAESVQLQLRPEDQQQLDEEADLRKQEGLWEYRRRHEVNVRHYLHTDVLKDPASAVVWWLAKHADEPGHVAESIGILNQLAHAANNTPPTAPAERGTEPQTPAERFDAFLDSLASRSDENVRRLLTHQVASLIDVHDQKAAVEMRQRWREPADSDVPDDYQDYPAHTDGTQPE